MGRGRGQTKSGIRKLAAANNSSAYSVPPPSLNTSKVDIRFLFETLSISSPSFPLASNGEREIVGCRLLLYIYSRSRSLFCIHKMSSSHRSFIVPSTWYPLFRRTDLLTSPIPSFIIMPQDDAILRCCRERFGLSTTHHITKPKVREEEMITDQSAPLERRRRSTLGDTI